MGIHLKNRAPAGYIVPMARRSRRTDWEGIIRACGALVLLLVGFGGFKSGASGIILIFSLVVGLVSVVGVFWLFMVLLRGLSKPANPTIQKSYSILPDGLPEGRNHPNISDALDALDWFQFEQLVARLFEAKACTVQPRGGAKADGGIDLVVEWGATKAAVQCKHWSKWKCGPAVVRELIGSMIHEGFSQGFLVCRTATDAAQDLARQHGIRVIDRDGVIQRINEASAHADSAINAALFFPEKLCPKCGNKMVLRTATKGREAGNQFWGCATFPRCRQKLWA